MKEATLLIGDPCRAEDLALPRAIDLHAYVQKESRYLNLVGCYRRVDGAESIELGLDIEVPQHPSADIRASERVMITLWPDDMMYPEVLALREDFPIGLIHTNRRETERPVSLCLFEEPYEEVKRHLSAHELVEQVRRWFALAARGELHAEDQAIERFIDVAGTLVLPCFPDSGRSDPIFLVRGGSDQHPVFIAFPNSHSDRPEPLHHLISVSLRDSENGRINRTPSKLSQLSDVVSDLTDVPLLTILREQIRKWYDDISPKTRQAAKGLIVSGAREQARQQALAREEQTMARFFDGHLIILLNLPRRRKAGSKVEQIDRYAFYVATSMAELATEIDSLVRIDGKLQKAALLGNQRTGDSIAILPLRVVSSFDAPLARVCSGYTTYDGHVALIGAGALGSQLFFALIRGGWGRWSVIDQDVLLPHNLARHSLFQNAVGYPKAKGLQLIAGELISDESQFHGIVADVLRGDPEAEQALREALLVVDCSASVSVARFLGSRPELSRCVSLFMNPAGSDLVMLAEDSGRLNKLDTLEMCYLRSVASQDALASHLSPAGRMRYGGSCRDISFILPPHVFSLHASHAAEYLQKHASSPHPGISIWRHDSESMETRRITIEPRPYHVVAAGDWKVLIDPDVFRELQIWRRSKLPNETGGVLLGAIDIGRHHIYVVMGLDAPSDSEEWPTSYIRGCQGLKSRCDEIAIRTQHEIQYLGEWHSHPDGASTQLSPLDKEFIYWLESELGNTGRPPVVFIAGQDEFGVYCGGYRFVQACHPVPA